MSQQMRRFKSARQRLIHAPRFTRWYGQSPYMGTTSSSDFVSQNARRSG